MATSNPAHLSMHNFRGQLFAYRECQMYAAHAQALRACVSARSCTSAVSTTLSEHMLSGKSNPSSKSAGDARTSDAN
eukprot:2000543-Pleurochrysis_carterae.AAC.1